MRVEKNRDVLKKMAWTILGFALGQIGFHVNAIREEYCNVSQFL